MFPLSVLPVHSIPDHGMPWPGLPTELRAPAPGWPALFTLSEASYHWAVRKGHLPEVSLAKPIRLDLITILFPLPQSHGNNAHLEGIGTGSGKGEESPEGKLIPGETVEQSHWPFMAPSVAPAG